MRRFAAGGCNVSAGGAIVVAQSGTRNTLSSASVLPAGTLERARSTHLASDAAEGTD